MIKLSSSLLSYVDNASRQKELHCSDVGRSSGILEDSESETLSVEPRSQPGTPTSISSGSRPGSIVVPLVKVERNDRYTAEDSQGFAGG